MFVRRAFALVALLCLLTAAPAAAAPRLSYGAAKHAIQVKADAFAGTRTKITAMYRLGRLAYSGSASWARTDPTGCKGCGYDPASGDFYDTPSTESCSATLHARKLRSGRIRVGAEDLLCY